VSPEDIVRLRELCEQSSWQVNLKLLAALPVALDEIERLRAKLTFQWEYHEECLGISGTEVRREEIFILWLNEKGKDGWELVERESNKNTLGLWQNYCLFKRLVKRLEVQS
jgi:hypothetical protein